MKKMMALTVVAVLLASTAALAQPLVTKKWELSTAISFTSFSLSGATGSETVVNIPLRLGYVIWKSLEVEPEIMYTKFKGSTAGYLISGNVLYNFLNVHKSLVPFVLAGIGFGNGLTYAGISEGSSDVNSLALHFGAGVKYVVGNSAAFRLEYRYSHYHLTETGFSPDNYNFHQLLTGISLFF
jgi:opacity protein-like surface antigen